MTTIALHLYRRMMRKGRLLGLLALSAVPGLVLWLAGLDADQAELASLYADIVSTVGFSFSIAALVLTVATLREERDGGTLPYLYMRPWSRSTLAVSSLLAGGAAALTLALGGWLATVGAGVAIGVDLSAMLPGLILFAGAAVGYASLFVPLGYLVPRSLLVGLGYVVVVESILSNVVTGLAQLSIWRIALRVYADVAGTVGEGTREVLGPVEAGLGEGSATLVGVLIAGFVILTLALRHRDAL